MMISNRFRLTGRRDNNNEHDPNQSWVTRVPLPLHQRTNDDGGLHPWRVFEERVRTGPYGLSRFPSQPYSPIRILILDGGSNIGREDNINPRLRRFIQNSPPRIRNEWNLWTTPEQEDPGLTENEFKSAMKQLKKQVYQPSYPPKRAYKRGIFGGRRAKNENEIEVDTKDEGKDCSICLEAFTRNEQVLVTPCKHMFHSDCITPWVKSHGKCPVCRFEFYKRNENHTSRNNNRNNNNNNSNNYNDNGNYNNGTGNGAREIAEDDELALDLIALIRAMEEAFNWVTLARAISYE